MLLLGCGVAALVALWEPLAEAQTSENPTTFLEFLTQYVGKEILLLDFSPDMGDVSPSDSLQRYVAVLESVTENGIVVRRIAESDKRSLTYPLSYIRRITYLFNGRRYRRIVVETQ